ncbi:MAG: S9 family peptidase [Gemmatimonadota bacterium]
MRSPGFGLTAVLILTASCGGERPRSAEPDSLFSLKTLLAPATYVAPTVSPDGRWVSYLKPVEGAMNLFVAPVDSLAAARALTHRTGRGLQAFDVSGNVLYRWSPDSKRIIFPEDNNGDEKWNLHGVELATGVEKNLTPIPGKAVALQIFSDADPTMAAIAVRDRSPFIPDIYRLDVATGERKLILANDRMLAVFPDRNLKPRFGLGITPAGTYDIYKLASDGSWKIIWKIGEEDLAGLNATVYQRAWAFDENNSHLYMYDTEGRDAAALVALDLETGERTPIASDPKVDLAAVLYHPTTYRLQAYATMWTRTKWTVLDSALKEDFARLERVADGDLKILSRSLNQEKWVVEYMLSDAPTAYYLYDRPTGKATKLFVGTPQLEGVKFSKFHPFEITSRDGLPLVSYYVLPPWSDPDGDGKPNVPQPAVMVVHGGPSDERAQWGFGPIVHWLANRGYAVIYVNYRGSAGFGKKYMNAQNLEWGGKMHEDLLEQKDWLVKQGIIDKDRVAILGGSYGGYATLVGMTMTPDAFACGVDLVGPSNLEKFMPHWNVDRMSKVVGDPRTEAGRKLLRSRSPINFASQTKHPVLIGQGSNDARVPKYQSDTVVAEIKKAGVPVVYAVYPDEGHGLQRPANSFSFWAIGEQFLAKCLGGRAKPLTDDFEGSSVAIEAGADYIPGLAAVLSKRAKAGPATPAPK